MSAEGMLNLEDLQGGEFHTVIIAGVDMYGRLIGKRIPLRRFKEICTEGVNVSSCVYAWDVAQEMSSLKVDYAGSHTGWHDFRLVPDLNSLRKAAWLDGTAIVIADSVEQNSDDLVRIAPRTVLRNTVAKIEESGYSLFTATELEFHLYKGTPDQLRASGYSALKPTTDIHADYNISEGDRYEPFFLQVRNALERSGVPVEIAQVEYGPGQWEINLEYGTPLECADRHVLFKHIIRQVAATNGLTATFMPRPLTEGMGSSCHIHASLQSSKGIPLYHDVSADRSVTELLLHSVGGVLNLTPKFMLWYAPTINSMRRILTQDYAGNGLTWGFDNRTTTCRLITGSPSTNRLEMRLPGSDANPYLALAAVLTSILVGVTEQIDPGPETFGDAYAAAGAPLPRTLGEAADAFRNSSEAIKAFGADVVKHFSDVADHEWSLFLRAVTDWDRTRYLESI